jgi:hypothetical protein
VAFLLFFFLFICFSLHLSCGPEISTRATNSTNICFLATMEDNKEEIDPRYGIPKRKKFDVQRRRAAKANTSAAAPTGKGPAAQVLGGRVRIREDISHLLFFPLCNSFIHVFSVISTRQTG